MFNFFEREIITFLRRFIYSSIFIQLRKSMDKYNQWKSFYFSLGILLVINFVLSAIFSIILPFGVMGTLVISFILFIIYWKNRIDKLGKVGNTRNSKYWSDRQFWYSLSGWQFEEEVADVFRRNGYKAEVTKGSGDGGVDIIMEKDGLKYIVQCKHYNGHKATPQELRALWGVMEDFRADVAIMVASDGITDMGRSFVSNKPNYKVFTLDDIIKMSINNKKTEQKINTKKDDNFTIKINNVNNLSYNASIVFGCAFVILSFLYILGIVH